MKTKRQEVPLVSNVKSGPQQVKAAARQSKLGAQQVKQVAQIVMGTDSE